MWTKTILVSGALGLIAIGCASPPGQPGLTGLASYYSDALAGQKTASGEAYDPEAATCAHRTLPLGTHVRVHALRTAKEATCRINDRGPYAHERILDVSRSVAAQLDMLKRGVTKVRIEVVDSQR